MADAEKKKGSILLVEDDRGTCELEAQRLEPLGLELRKVHDIAGAMAALDKAVPDLMLVDYSLPGANALELVTMLKKAGKPVPPFIVVTGRGDEKVAVEAMKAGALDYLVKTSDFLDNLLPAAAKSLEKIRLLRDLKAAQTSTARNLHLYTFLSQVNLAATQRKDRQELFREICEIAVRAGGMRMAWIGLPDRDLNRVIPFCWAGTVDGYLDGIKVEIGGETTMSKGPTGRAATLRQIQACPDIAADGSMTPWKEKAAARGYRSSAAIPLEENGRLAAVLTIYSEESGFFSGDELKLLDEIKADLSLALNSIASEESRAAAQAALERTAAQLAHIMDVTPVILFKLTKRPPAAFSADWISGNAAAITGYAPEEMLNPGWWLDNIHPDDRDWVIREQKDLAGKKSLSQDFRFKRKDGAYFWVHSQLNLARAEQGEINGSWTDITRLKQSEERMQLLNDAIGSSFDEVYIFGSDSFRFLFLNKAAFKNLGYSTEEASCLTPWDIKPEFTEASFRKAVQPLLAGDKHFLVFETRHLRKDGTAYPVEVRLQTVESAGRKVFLAIVNDITERRKSEALLAEMANMQRVESLGALAGGIAHDFNNMLTGIMANLSLMSARIKDGQNADILHDTMEAARSAQVLTQQLMAFAKGGKPVKKEFCLGRSLKEIFSLATRGTSCTHDLDLQKDLWSVDGDEGQIKQAVNNLLLNALQAMPSGGTLTLAAANLRLESERGALPAGNYIKLTVSDTGIGIPKEYLPRIFEPYFTTKSQGHGLGLPMTWSVVKNHGGHIEAASEPGKGTSFELLLPATGRALAPERDQARAAVKGTGKILLLEDEELLKKAAVRMLKELGYTPEVTNDGKETLAAYRKALKGGRPFAAVIMDLTIPGGMGGREAVAELRKLHPAAKVIVSSGYSDEAVMADYKAYGFDAVLPKPYTYEQMAETLAKVLAGPDRRNC